MADRNYEIIYRMPKVKALQPKNFGITLAVAFICIGLGFWHSTLTTWTALISFIVYVLVGYYFGWFTARIYNMVLFLSVKKWYSYRKKKNILFCFQKEEKKVMNIIKSPIAGEEVQIDDEHKERKIYKTEPHPKPAHPYTIAFIASPFYMHYDKSNTKDYTRDPIMEDKKFFYSSVGRALDALDNDEVLGRPEIWDRTRIITIFYKPPEGSKSEDYCFVGESGAVYREQLVDADDIISPFTHLDQYYGNGASIEAAELNDLRNSYRDTLAENFGLTDKEKKIFDDVDVIYFLTANQKYIRSSARVSEGEIKEGTDATVEYAFNQEQPSGKAELKKHHEKRVQIPGLVALNVIYARDKTYIHEFAHAMSHEDNGAIFDEYYDTDSESEIFGINALIKNNIDIPKAFTEYYPPGARKVQYHSDRAHPSAEDNWQRYFPLREAKHIGCTMDRTIGEYQFDKLISAFMYDRLITKISR